MSNSDELVQLKHSAPLSTVKKLLQHGGSLVSDNKINFSADVSKAIQQSVNEFTTYMTTLALMHMNEHNETSKNKRKVPSSDDLYHAIDDLDIPFIRQQVALRSIAQSRTRWLALAKKKEAHATTTSTTTTTTKKASKNDGKNVNLDSLRAESEDEIEQDDEEEEEEEEEEVDGEEEEEEVDEEEEEEESD